MPKADCSVCINPVVRGLTPAAIQLERLETHDGLPGDARQ